MVVSAPVAICLAGPWPPTPSNVRGLSAWIESEKPAGQPWQWFNPLNTTNRWGSIGVAPYGPGISIYPDPATGAMACARTIKGLDGMAGWPGIEASLRAGTLGGDFQSNAQNLLDPPTGSAWGSSPSLVASLAGNPNPLGGTTQSRLMGAPPRIPQTHGLGLPSLNPVQWLYNTITKPFERFVHTAVRGAEIAAGGTIIFGGIAVMVAAASGVAENAANAYTKGLTRKAAGTTTRLSEEEVLGRHEAKLQATTKAQAKRRAGATRSQTARKRKAAEIIEEREKNEQTRKKDWWSFKEGERVTSHRKIEEEKTEQQRKRIADRVAGRAKK